ncbi:hypothetical protein FDP41_008532 [Naegleria fowleri]|uniref:Uncharacterized protein n=1 Tax=Naegleria fowleri TaxID=5763 RepID=A0A6A5BH18_NAEFO|nr:uncharacterized protein FDP41_008532 [Naegleria fowleri]KAF0973325.1 hypothetical protein FDP41_008532 [Naegleria fowleri]CAG4710918.1 unnamed protein product [Naegleria fowleri]
MVILSLIKQHQFDLVYEIFSYCNDKRSIFRILFQCLRFFKQTQNPFHRSLIKHNSEKQDPQKKILENNIKEFLDLYGFKFLQFRVWKVYRFVVEKFETQLALKMELAKNLRVDNAYTPTIQWIKKQKEVKKLLDLYKILVELFMAIDENHCIFKQDHSQIEFLKYNIIEQLKISTFSKLFNLTMGMTLFEMYQEILQVELQLLKDNFWNFTNDQQILGNMKLSPQIQHLCENVDFAPLFTLQIAFHIDDHMSYETHESNNLLRDFEWFVYTEAGPLIPYLNLTLSKVMIQGLSCRMEFECDQEIFFRTMDFKTFLEGNIGGILVHENNNTKLCLQNTNAVLYSDAVLVLYDYSRAQEFSFEELNQEALEQIELLPLLRRVVLQYPFSPIVLVIAENGKQSDLIAKQLVNFPHVTGVFPGWDSRTIFKATCQSTVSSVKSCSQLEQELSHQKQTQSQRKCEMQ